MFTITVYCNLSASDLSTKLCYKSAVFSWNFISRIVL